MNLFSSLIVLLAVMTIYPATSTSKKGRRRNLDRKCLAELRRSGTGYKLGPFLKGMRTPVTIPSGKIGKIQYMNGRKPARAILDCRAALALYRLYPLFSANGGISRVLVGNFYSYRYVKNSSELSRHAVGLGIDIYGITTADGKTYTVSSDYQRGLGAGKTCEGHARARGARLLRQLACDLDRSHYFRAILTPDADRDHRDHFHLSVYGSAEKRTRKYRTTLIEYQFFGYSWVKRQPTLGRPSSKRVWSVVRQRRRANHRLLKKRPKRLVSGRKRR